MSSLALLDGENLSSLSYLAGDDGIEIILAQDFLRFFNKNGEGSGLFLRN
jgi:hypothetical protein